MRPLHRPPLPLDLPRLLMRRATWVGLAVLVLALLLGLQRMDEDIRAEEDAAMHLATLMSRLGTLAPHDDASAFAALRELQQQAPLRHLALHIHDTTGRTLLAPAPPAEDPPWLGPLRRLHAGIAPEPTPRRVSWLLPRPGGPAWVISLDASADSERREALSNLAGTLVLLLLAIAGLLAVMQLNLRHALAPLAALLGAIAGIERQDPQAVARLPAMPLRELEAIAAALRHLAAALDEAEQRRRLLSQKLLTLQEDERHHLARELHDELGQRLTALRFDAAWLQRRLGAVEADGGSAPGGAPGGGQAIAEVVNGMLGHCADLQRDVRQLLRQLDPFGAEGPAADAPPLPLGRLLQLLDALVQGWQGTPAAQPSDAAPRFEWHSGLGGAQGPLRPWAPGQAEAIALPRPLALALYRLSQEALTNALRHARATRIELRLAFSAPERPGAPAQLHWRVQDDGIGLADAATALQRGNGLGGMQERVWALGGVWHSGPAAAAHPPDAAPTPATPSAPLPPRPGWRLQAHLPLAARSATPTSTEGRDG